VRLRPKPNPSELELMQAVNLMYSILVLMPGALSLHLNPTRQRPSIEKQTVVMVRTCNPQPGMLARIAKYEKDLQNKAPLVQLVVSMDRTNVDRIDDLRRTVGPNTLVHGFNWYDDVEPKYPVLASVADATGWNFHVEAISVAMQYVKQHAVIAKEAPVWVLEDDVFFCGSISDFISSYYADKSDLLSASYKPFVDNWSMSAAFDFRFPYPSRVQSYEHVQRFSQRFLDYLGRESRDEEVTAMSEIFVPTECWNSITESFTCGTFKADHIGDYNWYNEMTKGDAKAACERSLTPTINHGAKFYHDQNRSYEPYQKRSNNIGNLSFHTPAFNHGAKFYRSQRRSYEPYQNSSNDIGNLSFPRSES